ncbi:MAG: hypothetical protein KDJ50_11000, partial [Alphaproteobacteria bacterium]|nr:hypothetical protein [Alphaproteobacteria bacterium]
ALSRTAPKSFLILNNEKIQNRDCVMGLAQKKAPPQHTNIEEIARMSESVRERMKQADAKFQEYNKIVSSTLRSLSRAWEKMALGEWDEKAQRRFNKRFAGNMEQLAKIVQSQDYLSRGRGAFEMGALNNLFNKLTGVDGSGVFGTEHRPSMVGVLWAWMCDPTSIFEVAARPKLSVVVGGRVKSNSPRTRPPHRALERIK